MRHGLPLLLTPGLFASCNNTADTVLADDTINRKGTDSTAMINGHPARIEQGNSYEVNERRYTPEGTFSAAAANLPQRKDMGMQTLWFRPINPISKTNRKGKSGRYYAVANYDAMNPEVTMEEWKALVTKAHSMAFEVIIDRVPADTMIDAMKFPIRESGFRKKCILEVQKMKPVFMPAENNEAKMYNAGFDASCPRAGFRAIKKRHDTVGPI